MPSSSCLSFLPEKQVWTRTRAHTGVTACLHHLDFSVFQAPAQPSSQLSLYLVPQDRDVSGPRDVPELGGRVPAVSNGWTLPSPAEEAPSFVTDHRPSSLGLSRVFPAL